jgi:plastocyanin
LPKSLRLIAVLVVLAIGAISATVPALAGAPATVEVQDGFFFKDKLTVKKGTKVTWKWTKSTLLPHDVTVVKGPVKFHSPIKLSESYKYSHVFTKAGIYKIESTPDGSSMKMTVLVKN